jgi:hypothetical protein
MIAGSGNWDEDERSWERSCRRTAEVEYDREFDGFEAFKSSLMTFGNVSSALLSPLTTYGNYSLATRGESPATKSTYLLHHCPLAEVWPISAHDFCH